MDRLASPGGHGDPDEVWEYIRQVGGSEPLQDDFSLLEIQFA